MATLCLEDIDQDQVVADEKLINKDVEQKKSIEVLKKELFEKMNETQSSKTPTVTDCFNIHNRKRGRSLFGRN